MNDQTPRRTGPADESPSETSRRFDDAFRAWAARPPKTPADRASQRVAQRLSERTRLPQLHRLAVAAALVVAIGAAVVLRWSAIPGDTPAPPASDPSSVIASTGAAAAPDGDVLVIDLDSQTTLYLNLDEPGRQSQN